MQWLARLPSLLLPESILDSNPITILRPHSTDELVPDLLQCYPILHRLQG